MRDTLNNPKELSYRLLLWYDKNARQLPWRIPPKHGKMGVKPNPYHVWLSEVMLQQTTVAAVKDYFLAFLQNWPNVDELARADDADILAKWAGLGYYARARNLIKCARIISHEYQGHFPSRKEELLKLPGIGPYTASAIAAIAYDKAESVIDGNVERVISRLFAISSPLPKSKPEIDTYSRIITPDKRPGDYAQAMMDLGATICSPTKANCLICPLSELCLAYKRGIQNELPYKIAKPPKPVRHGKAWILYASDMILLEKRPSKGLLGGMLCFPSAGWDKAPPPKENHTLYSANVIKLDTCFENQWKKIGTVRHTFTHFHLILDIYALILPHKPLGQLYDNDQAPPALQWVPFENFNSKDMPKLMRKAWDMAEVFFSDYLAKNAPIRKRKK